jgi:N-acetylmuramoyl-L-alanine amidase
MKVVLDPGHGTYSEHKSHVVNGKKIYEGLINRQFAGMLGHLLKWDGHQVVYTVHPDDDRDLSLAWRVRVANQHPDALFISLHSNASPNHNARGWEIFTSRGHTKSDYLATCIYNEVAKVHADVKMRTDYSDGDADKEADFYVLRKTKGVAVLIETLFFDQPDDVALLEDLAFRQKMVAAYYNGIKEYLK